MNIEAESEFRARDRASGSPDNQIGVAEINPASPQASDEPAFPSPANLRLWARWQRGLRWPLGLGEKLPALRLLLVLDNLAGHLSYPLVKWLFEHGVMPLYTPVGAARG